MSENNTESSRPIRVTVDRLRLPRLCPVCGTKANDYVRILLRDNKADDAGSFTANVMWSPYAHQWRRWGGGDVLTLSVAVCSAHRFSYDSVYRTRTVCLIAVAFTAVAALLSAGVISSALQLGTEVPLWSLALVALFVITLFSTGYVFRPAPVERAFRVLSFDPGSREIVVSLSNPAYRQAFLEENPYAEEEKGEPTAARE